MYIEICAQFCYHCHTVQQVCYKTVTLSRHAVAGSVLTTSSAVTAVSRILLVNDLSNSVLTEMLNTCKGVPNEIQNPMSQTL